MPLGRPKIYEVDDFAFDSLSEESLYWLGFIFADGCVYKNLLIVCLAEKDVGHLEKLKIFLESTYPIRHTKSGTSYNRDSTFVWHSPRSTPLTGTLREYGMELKQVRCPIEDLAVSRHFWRGVVDGDGSLGVSTFGEYLYPYIGLAGHERLLEKFCEFVRRNGVDSAFAPTPSAGKDMWRAQTSGPIAGEIIKLLYSDSSIALDRKLFRAGEISTGSFEKNAPYTEGPSTVPVSDDMIVEAENDNEYE